MGELYYEKVDCFKCGACCIAFDIKSFDKKAGEVCRFLSKSNLCIIYNSRPEGCRHYLPDEICVLISTLLLPEKVDVLRNIYGV